MAVDFYKDMNPTEPALRRRAVAGDHLNSIGSLFGLPSGESEDQLVQAKYNEAKAKYPAPQTCIDLSAVIASIQTEITSFQAQKVGRESTGGNGRPQEISIEGYTNWMNYLIGISNQWQCQQAADQATHQQYLNDFNNELQSATNLSSGTDKTMTYIVIGGIGVVMVASLILIFRK